MVVLTEHTTKDGQPKIVQECDLPLTGVGVVDRIITNLAVFDVHKEGDHRLVLAKIAPGVELREIRKLTEPEFVLAEELVAVLSAEQQGVHS